MKNSSVGEMNPIADYVLGVVQHHARHQPQKTPQEHRGSSWCCSAFGLGTAQAKTDDQSTNEDILLTFDPENQKEVRKAYRQLSSLPNKRAVEK